MLSMFSPRSNPHASGSGKTPGSAAAVHGPARQPTGIAHRLRVTSVFRLALLLVVAAWLFVAFWYGFEAWLATADQAWFQLDSVAALAGAVSQQHFEQYMHGFDFLNLHLAQGGFEASGPTPSALIALLHEFGQTFPDLDSIGIVSPDGKVVAGSGAFATKRVSDPGMLRFLGQLRLHRGMRVAFAAAGSKQPIIRIGIAHRNAQGAEQYVLIADLDMRKQISLWRRLRLPDDAARQLEMGLMTRQGDLLGLWPDSGAGAQGAMQVSGRAVRQALLEAMRTSSSRLIAAPRPGDSGHVAWGALSRLHGVPVAAFVVMPRRVVWSAWWSRVRIPLFGWTMLSAMLGTLALRLSRARRQERQQARRANEAERAAHQTAVFYAALAETLRVLRSDDRREVAETLQTLVVTLCDVLGACAVFVGRLPKGRTWLDIVASAGSARDGVEGLMISADPNRAESQGPAGRALRLGLPQHATVDDPIFAAWSQQARSLGIAGILAAAGRTETGEAILLGVHYAKTNQVLDAAAEVVQRIADELARFLDRQAYVARVFRLERYRNALRKIQHRLLSAVDEASVYDILAQTLVAETDAEEVEVFIPDAGQFKRCAMAAAHSQSGGHSPGALPGECRPDGHADLLAAVWSSRSHRVLAWSACGQNPAARRDRSPRVETGVLAGWPILAVGSDEVVAVVTLMARSPHAIDVELQDLASSIMESAAMALRQVRDRARIEMLACRDPLTGLSNRRFLLQQLPGFLARARRSRTQLAIGILDLDDFKGVNDTWGHAAGDALLCELSQRLQSLLRGADHVARFGGDEFVFVIEDLAAPEDLNGVLSRLETAMRRPCVLPGGHQIRIGLSMGLTLYPEDDAGPEMLLRHADEALYAIKAHKASRQCAWMLWRTPPDLAGPTFGVGDGMGRAVPTHHGGG